MDNGIETIALSLMVQERQLSLSVDSFRVFKNDIHDRLFKIVKEYYKKYNEPIAEETLIRELEKVIEKEDWSEIEIKYAAQLLPTLFLPVNDKEYFIEETEQFIRKQSIIEAYKQSVPYLQQGKLDEALGLIDRAKSIGFEEDLGLNYFQDFNLDTTHYTEKIPTGMAGLDDALDGGIGRGELMLVLAKTNTGKSMFMVHLGWAAVVMGKKVVHYTLEMFPQKVARRYHARFTDILHRELRDRNDEVKKILVEKAKEFGNSLHIKGYPPKKCKLNDIERHLTTLNRMYGFSPDLILVDYADRMAPTRHQERRFEIEDLYDGLIAIGQKWEAAVVTASQPKKSSHHKDRLSLEDPIEAYAKPATADIVIALDQNDRDKSRKFIRLNVLKVRDSGGSSREMVLKTNFKKAQFFV